DLDEARFEILDALACAAEMRDPAAACHMNAVGELSAKLAHAVGLSGDEARMIGRAARLHDIGKIGVPSCTQVSGNNLSAQQIAAQRDHTLVGARLLGGFKSTLLRVASAIAHHHHERWDGSGYPDGLEGKEIPLPARIVAVADVFDALIHDRPYRKAWSPSAAVELILTGSGTHFDPAVVEAFKSFSWVEQRPEVSLCKA
ncbi:MAG TPA: HD domain-containing phosphohydrolase, partial [Gemmatimonadaceae bacterium]